ncbi:MAG: hypothetical protein FWF15_06235 [Oscillospiraceae bacterium]|nr:hypothetical protein [Oscillospiraceae bacterium]
MMPCVTRGEEKILHIMREIFYTCECLTGAITDLAEQDFSEEQRISMFEKAIQILEIIFDDGNFGFYNHRIANYYEITARNYILLNDYDKAFECLEKAADYYIAYEACADDETEFTALLVSKIPNPPSHHHDKPSNMTYDFIHDDLVQKDVYISIRGHARFKAVIEKLTPYAKENQYLSEFSKRCKDK